MAHRAHWRRSKSDPSFEQGEHLSDDILASSRISSGTESAPVFPISEGVTGSEETMCEETSDEGIEVLPVPPDRIRITIVGAAGIGASAPWCECSVVHES